MLSLYRKIAVCSSSYIFMRIMMRQGFQVIVAAAVQEVEYVLDFRDELRAETETRKLWKAWSGLLDHYAKSVSAMRRATDQGTSKGWSDKLLHEQRSDAVLQYAYQARDSINHVFENVKEVEPRSVSYGNFIKISGNSSIIMEGNVVIDQFGHATPIPDGTIFTEDGRFSHGTFPSSSLRHNEHYLVLNEVKTRSGVYVAPFSHLPANERAIAVADHICGWLVVKKDQLLALSNAENQLR